MHLKSYDPTPMKGHYVGHSRLPKSLLQQDHFQLDSRRRGIFPGRRLREKNLVAYRLLSAKSTDFGKLSSLISTPLRLTVSNNGWLACRLMLSATLCPCCEGGGKSYSIRRGLILFLDDPSLLTHATEPKKKTGKLLHLRFGML